MAITQLQLIEMYQETLRWFERELQWGVPVSELTHLITRAGQLFTAITTGGQLAVHGSQEGYDVVNCEGLTYSVNAIASQAVQGEVNFTREMLEPVDRVMILFLDMNELEMRILLDCAVEELGSYITSQAGGKLIISLESLIATTKDRSELTVLRELVYKDYLLRELETGAFEIELYGSVVEDPAPKMKKLAVELNIPHHTGMAQTGSMKTLGGKVMDAIQERSGK